MLQSAPQTKSRQRAPRPMPLPWGGGARGEAGHHDLPLPLLLAMLFPGMGLFLSGHHLQSLRLQKPLFLTFQHSASFQSLVPNFSIMSWPHLHDSPRGQTPSLFMSSHIMAFLPLPLPLPSPPLP